MDIDYSKKYSSEELFDMNPIDVYKIILNGNHNKRFPSGFWEDDDALNKASSIIRWLLESYLNLSRDEILEKVSTKFFIKYKLRGMVATLFNDSPIDAVMYSYPSEFKVWEFNKVPLNYWNLQNAIEASRWLIEDKHNFTLEDVRIRCTCAFFIENNLGGMLKTVFNGSNVLAIMSLYPGKFKPWELLQCPRGFWTKKTGIAATKWLVEERLKVNCYDVNLSDFRNNGLDGMLRCLYGSCYKTALKTAYPGEYNVDDESFLQSSLVS